MSANPRVWVDFMKTAGENRLLLTTQGTRHDLLRHGIELHEGLRLRVYSDDADAQGNRDDLVAEGTVHRDPKHGTWLLILDGDSIRHESDVR